MGFIIIIAVIIDFVIGFYVISPQIQSIKESKIKKGLAELQINGLSDKLTILKSLQDKITAYEDSTLKLDKVMPKSLDEASTLAIIEDVATRNGVFINNITPLSSGVSEIISGNGAKKPYLTASYSIMIAGDFNKTAEGNLSDVNINIMGFFEALEKSLQPIVIRNLRISGGGEQSKGKINPVNLAVEIDTYYLPR